MNGTIDYYNQNADAFASGTANVAFKIVRNDITKMNTEAIVNTANDHPAVGTGCDSAVYKAAGYAELLAYRTEKIGGFSTDLHRWMWS